MAVPAVTRTFIDNAIYNQVNVAPTAAQSIGLTVGGRYIALARGGRLTPAGQYYQQRLNDREGPIALTSAYIF